MTVAFTREELKPQALLKAEEERKNKLPVIEIRPAQKNKEF